MTLHLMKLAVGARDVAQLAAWQRQRLASDPPLRHLTRNFPRRAAEVTDGGSMYWIVGGVALVRQAVAGIVAANRPDGSACAAILLDPALVAVAGRPVKAFQGWRYLDPDAAPPDLATLSGSGVAELPAEMQQELRRLSLL